MTPSSEVSFCSAATVFVVQDVLRSVEHYRDVLDLDGNRLCFGVESKQQRTTQ